MKTKNLFVVWFMFAISFQSMTISKVALAESLVSSAYFPIEVGMKWTYLEDNLNIVTNSVVSGAEYINGVVTNAILQNGGELSGSKVNVSSDAYGIRRCREFSPNVFVEGVGFQNITVTYNPPLKLANATSYLGEIVNSSGTLDYKFSSLGLYYLNYTSTSKLVRYENITVPLGTFVTLKIQVSTTISGYINNQFINIPITQVS